MSSTDTGRARLAAWVLQDLAGPVREWLPSQRWFGGKARTIEAVDIEDLVWLPLEAFPCALLVLDVRYETAVGGVPSRDRYAMVIAFVTDPGTCPVVASVHGQPLLQVIEATTERVVLRALLQGLSTDVALTGERGGLVVYADATAGSRRLLTTGGQAFPSVSPVGVEQSNTSVRLGATHVFKLFRRLESGENPQIEIGRVFTRSGFAAVPPLEGSLLYTRPGADACVLGALEGWVDNQGDGWRYVLGRLEHIADEPAAAGPLADELRALGRTTADVHIVLASEAEDEAFVPAPITGEDRRAWRAQVHAQAVRTFDLIEDRLARWPAPVASLGRSVLGARNGVAAALGDLESGAEERFHKIRIHGDFHLGQTLKTRHGFSIIDFEGEPLKSLADRRQRHCALRDVAGMLRSFEYAVATVQARTPRVGAPALSAAGLREAFLEAYWTRARCSRVTFLPSTPEAFRAWLRFFELEKALYEVEYEVNNRPEWAHIPLGAVQRLLVGGS